MLTPKGSSPGYDEWSDDLAQHLAAAIGIELTEAHWKAIRFLREDFKAQGETATIRRVTHGRRHSHQGAVRAVPEEAGQEDGLHRRTTQTTRLSVKASHIMSTTETTPTETTTTAPAIVPNFDDDSPAERKLAIICSKGNLDMAYPGLILANAALGEGVETHLFFTFWGFDMITKSRMADLKFTMLGNTATHMPQGLGGLPGMTAIATHQMRKQIHDIGVPDVPEFLAQIVDSGGHLWACRMSANMMHLDESDLYEAVEGIISAADFIDKTEGAQLLFI
jgi:peroxiredoxin family protein